jgi:uncharacterized protein YjdB
MKLLQTVTTTKLLLKNSDAISVRKSLRRKLNLITTSNLKSTRKQKPSSDPVSNWMSSQSLKCEKKMIREERKKRQKQKQKLRLLSRNA